MVADLCQPISLCVVFVLFLRQSDYKLPDFGIPRTDLDAVDSVI